MERDPITVRIAGTPNCRVKSRRRRVPSEWTQAVIEQTRHLPLVTGPARLEAVFLLPEDRFLGDHPFGPDLDNLLKRLLDALNHTVLRDVAGRDSAIVEISAKKCRAETDDRCGAILTITPCRLTTRA